MPPLFPNHTQKERGGTVVCDNIARLFAAPCQDQEAPDMWEGMIVFGSDLARAGVLFLTPFQTSEEAWNAVWQTAREIDAGAKTSVFPGTIREVVEAHVTETSVDWAKSTLAIWNM